MNEIPGLSELQSLAYGNSQIKIAVLDGPVDLEHPCFNSSKGNLTPWNSTTQVQPSAIPGLALKHGTAVTSLIFGTPESAVDGIAPGCSGLLIPIYSEDKNGRFNAASQMDLARAIKTAIDQEVHIINISGGQLSKSGEPEFFLKQAIDECKKAGILMVAATGNDGCSCLHVPAADRHVLAVGSMDASGNPTQETNFGESYQTNGILAPGKNRSAARPGGGIFKTNGATSYATPIISGIVGLLMSLQIKEGLQPNAYVIKSILEKTATPCIGEEGSDQCQRFLRGKLNLPAAIAEIKKNPGVLASGLEFTNKSKLILMEKYSNSEPEAVPKVPQEDAAVIPADNITEPTAHAHEAVTKEVMPSENVKSLSPETTINTPMEEDVLPADCGCSKEPDIELEKEEPEVAPADQELSQSEENSSLSNSNKSIKDMEDRNLNPSGITPDNPSSLITPSGLIDPSDCGCGGSAKDPVKAYALGTIGYDFSSESHRDSLVQSMGGANPHDPAVLLKYLDENPWDAEEIIWTLNVDSTPIYSLVPSGSHKNVGYERIREFLKDQINGNIQRISVPGLAGGSRTLINGQKVSLLVPRLRGMYSWTTEALVDASTKGTKGSNKALAENVGNFLNRIYYQMRNLGITSQERALNYAATNAFQVSSIFAAALKDKLELKEISATKSPICRPGSDCYDIILSFFNPEERLNKAIKAYRFTVDVSDVVPVTVGTVRAWSEY